MRVIYHLVPRATWEQAPSGPYADPSLAAEGFLHCSNAGQVERVANLFFAGVPELLVLHIDVAGLGEMVRDEPPTVPPGIANPFPGETFPHVYGPIDRAALLDITPLRRGPERRWVFLA